MELMPASGAAELLRRAATAQRNCGGTPQADRLTVHHSLCLDFGLAERQWRLEYAIESGY
jgi:hypothetical protein